MTEPLRAKISEKDYNLILKALELEMKKTTLEQVVRDWICDDPDLSPSNLVGMIEQWLPKEQSAAGSQNAYVECSVEGYNDCLRQIKSNLR